MIPNTREAASLFLLVSLVLLFSSGCSTNGVPEEQIELEVTDQQANVNQEDFDKNASNAGQQDYLDADDEAGLGASNFNYQFEQQKDDQFADMMNEPLSDKENERSEPFSGQALADLPGFHGGIAGLEAASGLPEMGSKMAYIVQKGDTLSNIAKRIYNDLGRWRDLAKWSNFSNPNLIYPGDLVYYQLTEESLSFAKAYENLAKREILIQSGTNLIKLSKRIYGSSDYTKELWRVNAHLKSPNTIDPGSRVFFYESGSIKAINAYPAMAYKTSVNPRA